MALAMHDDVDVDLVAVRQMPTDGVVPQRRPPGRELDATVLDHRQGGLGFAGTCDQQLDVIGRPQAGQSLQVRAPQADPAEVLGEVVYGDDLELSEDELVADGGGNDWYFGVTPGFGVK